MNEGGLDYKINVGGDWKAELSAFEDRINKLKADAAKLATTSVKTPKQSPTVSRSPEIRAEQALSDIEKKRVSLQRQARVIQDEGVQADLQSLKIARQSAQYSDIQSNARMRNAKAAEELKIKEAQINQLMRDQGITARKAAEQVGLTSAQAKQLKLNMWDAEHAARQFLFTFRRLVGILAVFTLARKFAQALTSGVREMIRFNSELEQTKNAFAAVIASVGQIYDGQGNLLTGQDKFNAAVDASNKVVKRLRKEAVGSIATFEALSKAFQVAVGPGLAAGLDLDQITMVTKRLVEGATAMQVPLDQMSEEIRSILQGTATSKNTRLVSLFGGSAAEVNEKIRQSKEQGRFYEYLMEKLDQMSFAAINAASSFAVLKSDLVDVGGYLSEQGGAALFNELKESLFGLRQALATGTTDGFILKPEALDVVKGVSEALAGIIKSVRQFTDTRVDMQLLADAVSVVGDVFKGFLAVALPILQGMADVVGVVVGQFRLFLSVVKQLAAIIDPSGKIGKGFALVLRYLGATLVTMYLVSKVTATWAAIWSSKALIKSLSAFVTGLARIGVLQKGVTLETIKTTIASRGWAAALGLLNIEMALLTFGISAVLGGLAIWAANSGVIAKATRFVDGTMEDVAVSANKLTDYIIAGGKALKENQKTTEEWKKELEDLVRATEKAANLTGMQGAVKDIVSLYRDAIAEIGKQAGPWDEQRKQADAAINAIQKKIDALRDPNSVLFGKYSGSMAKKMIDGLERDIKEIRIRRDQAIDSVTEIQTQEMALFKERIRAYIKENPEAQQRADLAVDMAQAEEQIAQNTSRSTASFEDGIVILEKQRAVIEATQSSEEQRNSTALKLLGDQIAEMEAQKGTEEELAQLLLQKEILQSRINKQKEVESSTTKKINKQIVDQNKELANGIELNRLRTASDASSTQAGRAGAAKNAVEAVMANARPAVRDLASLRMQQEVLNAEQASADASFKANQETLRIELEKATNNNEELKILDLTRQINKEKADFDNELLNRQADMLKNMQEVDKASLRASAKFTDGIRLGLLDFIQQAPEIGESIGAAVKGSLDGVASAFGASFREYLTTGQDVRSFFLNALGDVFLNIAEQFATNVAKNLLASMAGETLGKFLVPAASNAPLIASNTALVASINANTAAMGGALPASLAANTAATTGDAAATTANTGSLWTNTGAVFSNIGALLTNTAAIFTNLFAITLNTAATLMNTVATVLNTAMQALAGIIGSAATATAIAIQTAIQASLLLAIVGLLGMANFWLAGIFLNTLAGLFFKKGGLVPGGMADGGKVKGYAHGGKIGGFARPSSIPASDTVPAWLTPGEYVLPVNLVDKLGVGFLDALRSGVVSPSSFRDAGTSLMASSSAVRGFASGGAVSPASSSNTSGNRPVNVAFFDDRKAMRRWAESSEGETAIMKVMQRNSFKFA